MLKFFFLETTRLNLDREFQKKVREHFELKKENKKNTSLLIILKKKIFFNEILIFIFFLRDFKIFNQDKKRINKSNVNSSLYI